MNTLHTYVRAWLSAALAASPLEMAGQLQDYLDTDVTAELADSSGMGKSVALDIAKMMPSSVRQGEAERAAFPCPRPDGCCVPAEYPPYGGWKADTASLFSSAFGTRHTYGSEAKTVVGLCKIFSSAQSRELVAHYCTHGILSQLALTDRSTSYTCKLSRSSCEISLRAYAIVHPSFP